MLTFIDFSETLTEGRQRIRLVRVRIRSGKVQRGRIRVSNIKGFTVVPGSNSLRRIKPKERYNRRQGARRAKMKRRAKRAMINRKFHRALMRRKALGL